MSVFLELLKIIIPAGLVFAAAYFTIKRFLDHEKEKQGWQVKHENRTVIAPLRLQAFERLVLFLERSHPLQLILRIPHSSLNVRQFQLELITTIRQEFEHNLTQQIYISNGSWEIVKQAKEELIKLINLSAAQISIDKPAAELSQKLTYIISQLDKKLPSDLAIEYLKRELNSHY
jgi:hypothetical protein